MWKKSILNLLSGFLGTMPPPAVLVTSRDGTLMDLCQGDCQLYPCRRGLVCQLRQAGDPVSGCVLTATLLQSDHAFCVESIEQTPDHDDANDTNDDDRTEPIEPASDTPSDVPSDVPSPVPSEVPTRIATPAPTRLATSTPTRLATSTPTQATTQATVVNTNAPTVTRSQVQTMPPTIGQVVAPTLIGLCQAGCFVDTDCPEGLLCFQRTTNRGVPGCVMNQQQTDGRDNFCIPDPNFPSDFNYGGVTTTMGTVPGQLTECQGGCYTDQDCMGGLVCYQRFFDDGAPGCSMSPDILATDVNICLKNPTSYLRENVNIPADTSVFALKLYWEEGYDWQFESFERLFCLNCVGNCEPGAEMAVTNCFDSPRMWTLAAHASDGSALIKLHEFDLCIEWTPEFDSPPVQTRLQPCDSNNPNQRFWPSDGGSFDDFRFEISPRFRRGLCMTQEHHPMTNERVYFDYCLRPQLSDTSFWNKFFPG